MTDRLLLRAWQETPKGSEAERNFIKKIVELAGSAHRDAVRDAFKSRELAR